MNKSTFSLKNFSATTTLAALAFIGTTAFSTTTVVTTAAVLSIAHSSNASAAVICRDVPIDTTKKLGDDDARYFYYQPMKKSGLFGKCKKVGGVEKIKMLIPNLPKGVKLMAGKADRKTKSNGCSKGGIRGKILFHAACNAHDICYGSLGVPKFKCENMFLANMKKIAKHGPIGSRVKAVSWAVGVAAGVAAVGIVSQSHYDQGQNWARARYTSN